MPRFANPYSPRTDIGAGMQNIMTAMFANKGASGGGAAAHRSPAQDVRDQAEAEKARAEADQINRVEAGVGDFVKNFAGSLVPENEVPNVMERNKTGIWPAFEDPRRQQSVTEGVGPVDWNPEKDLQLNDAKRNQAYLQATKEANFKDLAASMEGASGGRAFREDLSRIPGLGLPSKNAAPAQAAGPALPEFGLPSGPGMLTTPTQATDEYGAVTKPMTPPDELSPVPLPPPTDNVAMPPAVKTPVPPQTEQTLPPVEVDGTYGPNVYALLEAAKVAAANGHNEAANAFTAQANAARGQQEADFKEREKSQWKPMPGNTGAFYNDKGKVVDAGGVREMTGAEFRALELEQKKAGAIKIPINTYERSDDKGRAESKRDMHNRAIKAMQYANTVATLADALEGYSGGPFSQVQASLGRYFPESDYGKIASIDDLTQSVIGANYSQVRAAGTGATSDFEAKGFIKAFPSLAVTPEGRDLIRLYAKRTAQREAVAAKIYGQMADAGNEDLMEWQNQVDKQAPLFSKDEWTRMNNLSGGRAGAYRGQESAGGTIAAPAANNDRLRQLEEEKRRRGQK